MATKDDVRDILYQLGIKNPPAIAAAIRMIDLYSFTLARKYAVPVVTGPRLLPGKADLEAGITCCRKCERVKAWRLFPYDTHSDSGHSDTCKACSDTTQVPRDPTLDIICANCGETKNADADYRRSNSKTGYRASCRQCENGRRRCAGECKQLRFPREYIKTGKVCVFCLAAQYTKEKKNGVRALPGRKSQGVPGGKKAS